MRAVRKPTRTVATIPAANKTPALPAEPRIARLREALDAVNHELLALLEKRGRLVHEVMEIKRESSLPVHDPERERRMTEALLSKASGVYPNASLERVFAVIFEISRALGRKPE
ncbi:MAG TPA: chorismate mutase [Steroidobacteraceae bacterium]|nr:chorismate mutase [Steroidobacteraceae bacterium]